MKKWTGDDATPSERRVVTDPLQVVREGKLVKRTTTRRKLDAMGRVVEEETIVEEFEAVRPVLPQPATPHPWAPQPYAPHWRTGSGSIYTPGPDEPRLMNL